MRLDVLGQATNLCYKHSPERYLCAWPQGSTWPLWFSSRAFFPPRCCQTLNCTAVASDLYLLHGSLKGLQGCKPRAQACR